MQEEPLQTAARQIAATIVPKPRYGEIDAVAGEIVANAKALVRHLSPEMPDMFTDMFDVMPKPKGQSSKIRLGSSFRDQNPEAWLKAKKRKRKLTKLNKKNGRKTRKCN